jgi:hypothetical protein
MLFWLAARHKKGHVPHELSSALLHCNARLLSVKIACQAVAPWSRPAMSTRMCIDIHRGVRRARLCSLESNSQPRLCDEVTVDAAVRKSRGVLVESVSQAARRTDCASKAPQKKPALTSDRVVVYSAFSWQLCSIPTPSQSISSAGLHVMPPFRSWCFQPTSLQW